MKFLYCLYTSELLAINSSLDLIIKGFLSYKTTTSTFERNIKASEFLLLISLILDFKLDNILKDYSLFSTQHVNISFLIKLYP